MSGDNSCLPGRKEDILKKKMERKGWLRSLIAGCMILFILFTCLPADWNLSAGTVYAAGTDGTLAAPDGDADPSGGSMQKGESNRVGADKAAGGEGTAAQTPADERDTAAQNTAAGERDTAAHPAVNIVDTIGKGLALSHQKGHQLGRVGPAHAELGELLVL